MLSGLSGEIAQRSSGLEPVGSFAEVVTEEKAEAVTAFIGMTAGVEDIGVGEGETGGAKTEGAKESFLDIHAPAFQPAQQVRERDVRHELQTRG